MFEIFRSNYSEDTSTTLSLIDPSTAHRKSSELEELHGKSFGQGLYRVLLPSEVGEFVNRINDTFPYYTGRVEPFAFDWLNRIYAFDAERTSNGEREILLFSHLTDEVLQVPHGAAAFHDQALIDNGSEIFDTPLFKSFLASSKQALLARDKVASMSTPLFLGGEYCLENLEVMDSEVDWQLTSQLLHQTRHLAEGDTVRRVSLSSEDL